MFPIGMVTLLSLASLTAGNGILVDEEQPTGYQWTGNTTVWAELVEASPEFRSQMLVHHKKMVPQLADLLLTNRFVQILTESIRAGFNIECLLMLNEHEISTSESWIDVFAVIGEAFFQLTNSTLGSLHASAVKFMGVMDETTAVKQKIEEMKSSDNGIVEVDEEIADSIIRMQEIVKEVFEIFTITFPAHGYNIGRKTARLVNPRGLIMTMAVQSLIISSGKAGDQWLSPFFPSDYGLVLAKFLIIDDSDLKMIDNKLQFRDS